VANPAPFAATLRHTQSRPASRAETAPLANAGAIAGAIVLEKSKTHYAAKA